MASKEDEAFEKAISGNKRDHNRCYTCQMPEVKKFVRRIVKHRQAGKETVSCRALHEIIMGLYPDYSIGPQGLWRHIQKCEGGWNVKEGI